MDDNDGTGRIGREMRYGGDVGEAPESCSDSYTIEDAQTRIEHTYKAGVLESSEYVEPASGATILSVVDNDIEAATGLVVEARDSAGIVTTFAYDEMTRLVSSETEGGLRTLYTYNLPGPGDTTNPTFTVEQKPVDSSTSLSWRMATYDGLGRQIGDDLSISASGTSSRVFEYDALNRKTAESLWNDLSSKTKIEYDRFGRTTKIDPPDPSLADTLFVYEGDYEIKRSDKVATNEAEDEKYVCYKERYDSFGRLRYVAENLASDHTGSCSPGAIGWQTTYKYDQNNNIREVRQIGGENDGEQKRFFTYDRRGFLASEKHPEIAPTGTGNGSVRYLYDASGNVLQKTIDGDNIEDHTLLYDYDAANRLIRLDEVTDSGDLRPLKEFQYARNNDGANKQAGKMVLSKRHNWVDLVNPLDEGLGIHQAIISQAYRYEGRDGRASERQTRYMFGGVSWSFDVAFEYDRQGNTTTIDYPSCTYFPCHPNLTERSLSMDYELGFLSSVEDPLSGFDADLTYQLGGMLYQIDRSNDVVDTYETDSNYPYQRPYQIRTGNVANGDNWTTGLYQYDGSGNVKAVGSRLYKYDRTSRLVSGDTDGGGSQSVTYDIFGNITEIETDGVNLVTNVDKNTNRLSGAGDTYDLAGNITDLTIGGVTYHYDYDALNVMKHLQSNNNVAKAFLYDANDERVITVSCPDDCDGERRDWHATIRDLGGRVLREFELDEPGLFSPTWQWKRDHFYRGRQLLAAVDRSPPATLHYHLDHLGSPRQITNQDGVQVALHSYYPFGAEATDPAQNEIPLKFTGHERDGNGSSGPGKLDYMHARFCSPALGRFLSVDPVKSGRAKKPQTWNRYSYAQNNPLKFLDPNGKTAVVFTIASADVGRNAKGALGHAAFLVQRSGRGNAISLGGRSFSKGVASFVTGYLQEGRRVRGFVLKDNAQAETKMLDFLKGDISAGTTNKSLLRGNCASGVCNTLRSGGLVETGSHPETTLFVDLPANLEAALQDDKQLGSIVEKEVIFGPHLEEVTPELIEFYLGIDDATDLWDN